MFEGWIRLHRFLIVPRGYVSGTFLSNSATYSGKTLATLGVTPGTYVWTWGTGANQNFTLKILPAIPGDQHHQHLDPRLGPNRPRRYYRRIHRHWNGPETSRDPWARSDPHAIWTSPEYWPIQRCNCSMVVEPRSSLTTIGKTTQQAAIQATGLAPSIDVESAILITLQPGNYTAILSGKNGTTGVGLVEVYDISGGVS